jgi:hypothetical protein
MRQNANIIAKATVDRVFAAVPGLNTNLRARFAGAPPPHLVPYQQEHKTAQAAQLKVQVSALQNPPPQDPTIVRAPPRSPEWARAWAEMQGHSGPSRRRKGRCKRRGMTQICARWRWMGGGIDTRHAPLRFAI